VDHLYTHEYHSPIGPLYLAVDRTGTVHRISYNDFRPTVPGSRWTNNKYACGEIEYQLDEYFAGERRHFTIDVAITGTDFQKAVWGRLRKVAYGHTMSYSVLAQKIGRRNAARAVGRAVGANPVVIVVPCHRIIHNDGTVGSYARNALTPEEGASIKERLLELERTNQ
jgi:methylated-DNA-[protein]-cysteine S-methyltransferase